MCVRIDHTGEDELAGSVDLVPSRKITADRNDPLPINPKVRLENYIWSDEGPFAYH
jgi:hypothetical protein